MAEGHDPDVGIVLDQLHGTGQRPAVPFRNGLAPLAVAKVLPLGLKATEVTGSLCCIARPDKAPVVQFQGMPASPLPVRIDSPSGLNATAETFSACSSGLPTSSPLFKAHIRALPSSHPLTVLAVGDDPARARTTLGFSISKCGRFILLGPFFQHFTGRRSVDRSRQNWPGHGLVLQDAAIDFALLAELHTPGVIVLGQDCAGLPCRYKQVLVALFRGIALLDRNCLLLRASLRAAAFFFPASSAALRSSIAIAFCFSACLSAAVSFFPASSAALRSSIAIAFCFSACLSAAVPLSRPPQRYPMPPGYCGAAPPLENRRPW